MKREAPFATGLGVAALAAFTVLVGALPRILLAMDALPGWLRPFVWSDVLHIWERGVRYGQLPYSDAFFEYPPLTGAVWAAIDAASGGSPAAHVALWAAVQAAGAAVVGYVLVREAGVGRTLLCWSASPQLLLYGSLNFETLALAPLVVALAFQRRARLVTSSVALAVGTAAKLFPAAVMPVMLVRARGTGTAAAVAAAFAGVLAATFAPTATAPFSSLASLQRYSIGIEPNLDSPWGLVREILRSLGSDPIGAIVAATLAGTALTYALLVLPAAKRFADPVLPASLAIVTVLIWSRLYSPQYALWVLPFFALASLSRRTLLTMTAGDIGVFFTIYPFTLVPWRPDDPVLVALTGALVAAVAVRHLALIAVWRELWSRDGRFDPSRRTHAGTLSA